MANHSPGDPLFPSRLSGVREALGTPYLVAGGEVLHVGNGSYRMAQPVMHIIPVERARYRSHTVPMPNRKDKTL